MKSEHSNAANIIVDLYEMRAGTLIPYRADRGREAITNMIQYRFFDHALAFLYDKYEISQEEVEAVIRERAPEAPPHDFNCSCGECVKKAIDEMPDFKPEDLPF